MILRFDVGCYIMDEQEIRDMVKKDLRDLFIQKVVRVKSDITLDMIDQEFREILEKEDYFDILTIDYSSKDPWKLLIDSYPGDELDNIVEGISLDTGKIEEDVLQTFYDGSNISHLIERFHEEAKRFVFMIKNAQEVSLEQCKDLMVIFISATACGELKNFSFFINGGDWWKNPLFVKDRLDEGASINYANPRIMDYPGPSFNDTFYEASRAHTNLILGDSPCSINAYGSHLSGKTYFLLSNHALMFAPQTFFSAYRKHEGSDGSAFIQSIEDRGVDKDFILIDDAHRLPYKAIEKIKTMYPKTVLTSLEKLPDCTHYVDLDKESSK